MNENKINLGNKIESCVTKEGFVNAMLSLDISNLPPDLENDKFSLKAFLGELLTLKENYVRKEELKSIRGMEVG